VVDVDLGFGHCLTVLQSKLNHRVSEASLVPCSLRNGASVCLFVCLFTIDACVTKTVGEQRRERERDMDGKTVMAAVIKHGLVLQAKDGQGWPSQMRVCTAF
jgi:hypothetical protein